MYIYFYIIHQNILIQNDLKKNWAGPSHLSDLIHFPSLLQSPFCIGFIPVGSMIPNISFLVLKGDLFLPFSLLENLVTSNPFR